MDFMNGPWLGIGITIVVLLITGIAVIPMLKQARTMMKGAQEMMKAQTAAANLRITGLPGQARVMNIQPTGTLINAQPVCIVDLEVYRPNLPPYVARIQQILSQVVLPRVQPGMTVPVKVDAANPANVALDV